MHPIPPGLDGPTLEQPQPEGIPPLPYQLGANAQDQPCAIMRYAISPAERAAIARGDDLFVVTYLDDRPLPATSLHVGSPLVGQGTDPGPLPDVIETDSGETIVNYPSSETPAGMVDVIGGPLDGTVMTAAQLLERFIGGELGTYGITRVEDWGRGGVVHYRLLHRDELRRLNLADENEEDEDDDDEGDRWKRGT